MAVTFPGFNEGVSSPQETTKIIFVLVNQWGSHYHNKFEASSLHFLLFSNFFVNILLLWVCG